MKPGDVMTVRLWGAVHDQVGRHVAGTRPGDWSALRYRVVVEAVDSETVTLTGIVTERVRVLRSHVHVEPEPRMPKRNPRRTARGWTHVSDAVDAEVKRAYDTGEW